ncbi:HTH-type transcriptional regulator RutR [Terrarubrum flagellatum]|uniref:HTH-type transcriptional regulator RutR n=1 Tax=Terrirubrum flagellatum TaxID=2895980 RepID=UPI003144E7F4
MAGAARAKTRMGEANVERILDAALTLFGQYGLRGARIDEIAALAGMSKTNLLYYFSGKEALYTAVLERTLEMWLKPLIALDPSAEPREALSLYIASKLNYSRSHPEASRLFAMEILQGAPHLKKILSTTLAAIVSEKQATIQAWMDRGKMRPVSPLHLIFTIWAATQHYADFAVQVEAVAGKGVDDDAFFEEARRQVTDLILNGALVDRG